MPPPGFFAAGVKIRLPLGKNMAYDRPSDDVNSTDSGIHGGGKSPALRLLIQVDKRFTNYKFQMIN